MQKGLALVVILLTVVAVGVVAVWPAYQILQQSLNTLKIKENELETKGAYYDNINTLFGELNKYTEELAKIDSALPEKNSPASLFRFIQQTGSENGMILKDIGSFSTDISAGNSKIKEVRADFTVLGSYSAFRNFLGALEKSSRLIKIKSVSIPQEKKTTATEDIASGASLLNNGADIYSFNIKITTYSY